MPSDTVISQSSDKTEKAPMRPDVRKIGDVKEIEKVVTKKIGHIKGIEKIITHLKKGEWMPMVGAIMTVLSEYFGTSKKDVKADLQDLQESVDQNEESKDEEKAEDTEDDEVMIATYKPGTKKPTISPKHTFKAQVEQIYAQENTFFTVGNLHEYFGPNYKKFLIERDPVTNEYPVTFLGRPISGGVNLMMLPFLKIAEKRIDDMDLNYIPAQKEIRGFQDRNMCVADSKGGLTYDPKIPSFHKYGLAVDLDPDFNWPKDGRGDIPDEVMVIMAEAGFNLGCMGDKTASHYLINDLMHFQMRFPPGSTAGQKIINASSIGKKYWNTVNPMLEDLKLTS